MDDEELPSNNSQRRRVITFVGLGAPSNASTTGIQSSLVAPYATETDIRSSNRLEAVGHSNVDDLPGEYPTYITRQTTGRNAQFFGLSKAEREHLGGVEYSAITLLSFIVPVYFFLWQFLGCISLGAYMAANKRTTAEQNGIRPWYAHANYFGYM